MSQSPRSPVLWVGYPDGNLCVPWVPHTTHKRLTPAARENPPTRAVTGKELFMFINHGSVNRGFAKEVTRLRRGKIEVTKDHHWANGVVCRWGWTDSIGFYFFSTARVRPIPRKIHVKGFRPDFNRIPWNLVKIWSKLQPKRPFTRGLRALRARNRQKVSKRVFWGVCTKISQTTLKVKKISGFGPGDSCKWSLWSRG